MINQAHITEESDNQQTPRSTCNTDPSTRTNSLQRIDRATEDPTGVTVGIPDSTMRPMPADLRCPRRGGTVLRPVYNIPRLSNFRPSLLELFILRILPGALLLFLIMRISREVIQSTYIVTKLTGRNPIPALLDLIGKSIFF